MRTLTFKILAPLAFSFVASSALAHARLETATPAVGSTVAAPSEIRLHFSEGVEPRFSGLTLTAANGSTAPLGSPSAEGAGRDILVVPVAKPLSPGVYTVHWHAVSVDTHRTQGLFQFTVK